VAAPLASISKDELWKRLLVHAVWVFHEFGFSSKDTVLPGFGKSPEDYAQTVFMKYLLGQIKAKNLTYLCRAVRNDIIDDLRSPAQKLTESRANLAHEKYGAENPIPSMDDLQSLNKSADDVLSEESYIARLRRCVESEPELKEYLEAIVDLGLDKPAEIGSFLGISPEAVRARQKKMRRRMIGHGIVEVKK
jgi:DNA-directed RNA polymerase specialized sigma24 family protein